jgi:hypothetical protein
MKTISMDNHDMVKQNLVTTKQGDSYRCLVCGVEGWRQNVSPIITITEAAFLVAEKCTFLSSKPPKELPAEVKVRVDMPNFGIEAGIHKVVPCPDEYKNRYADDVWVWSEGRKEPVRLLPGEYYKK